MEEYFKINNQFKKYLPVFLMMLSLILLLGTSYALIKNGNKGENSYVVNIGNLEVTFVDSETDNLVLDNMVPMSDTDGANQSDELSVTIENTGGAYAQYNIYIEETSSGVEFKSQIRFITNKNNTGYGTVKTLSEDKYIDKMGELNASETATLISSISSIENPILLAIPDVVSLIIPTYSGLAVNSIFILSQAKVYPSILNILSNPVILKIFLTLFLGLTI